MSAARKQLTATRGARRSASTSEGLAAERLSLATRRRDVERATITARAFERPAR